MKKKTQKVYQDHGFGFPVWLASFQRNLKPLKSTSKRKPHSGFLFGRNSFLLVQAIWNGPYPFRRVK